MLKCTTWSPRRQGLGLLKNQPPCFVYNEIKTTGKISLPLLCSRLQRNFGALGSRHIIPHCQPCSC